MTQKDTIIMTEAGTLAPIPVSFNNIDWMHSSRRIGTIEDFGLYRRNAADTDFKPFPVSGFLPNVSELYLESGEHVVVVHSLDDVSDAYEAGITTLHMNKKVSSAFLRAIDETKRHTAKPLITQGLGTSNAVRFTDKKFDPVSKPAHDIKKSYFDGTLFYSIPVISANGTAKPADAIQKSSSHPPTVLNPHP